MADDPGAAARSGLDVAACCRLSEPASAITRTTTSTHGVARLTCRLLGLDNAYSFLESEPLLSADPTAGHDIDKSRSGIWTNVGA